MEHYLTTEGRPAVLAVAVRGYAARWWFAIESQRAYAARHGFVYLLKTEEASQLNGKWSKLHYALELLSEGRHVFLIDADAEITPRTPPFDAIIAADQCHDIFFARGVSGRPNSGVLLLRGGESSRATALIQTCLEHRGQPVPEEDFVTPEGENGHIIHFLKQPFFAAHALEIERVWNCSIPEEFNNAFVRHYTNRLRESLMGGGLSKSLSTPLAVRSAEDLRFRAVCAAHVWHRPHFARQLDGSPEQLSEFRTLVREIGFRSGLVYPRLPIDDANAWIWRYEFASGLLEASTIEILLRLARDGFRMLDGGAHVGYFARTFERATGGACRVIAVEAHPDNLEALAGNTGRATTIIQAALGGEDGEGVLNDGFGHSNSSLVVGSPGCRKISVPLRTIDSLCSELGVYRLDILKLDIEGSEPDALRGATRMLTDSADIVVIVEINPALLRLCHIAPEQIVELGHEFGLISRLVNDDFSLGPAGFSDPQRTRNYLMARPHRWVSFARDLFEAGQGL